VDAVVVGGRHPSANLDVKPRVARRNRVPDRSRLKDVAACMGFNISYSGHTIKYR